ncbi:MAG: serine hydrolase domain-containing protein [Lysobacterales bacterium]
MPKPPTATRTLALFLALLATLPAAADPAPQAAIDAVFADYDRRDAPGCALGMIRDGEFIYRRGYGMANLEYDIPIGPKTVFRIGSTSKQFTATAIALLAASGAISLDDPVRRFFPEFPAWADAMTVRQLLHHTSGIRDYLQLAYLAGRGGDADYYTDDWVLRLLSRQRGTNFPPGSEFLYSNSGYLLLAHIIRRVSGQSLRTYAAERIFRPLGMAHTHFQDDHTEIVPGRADGYAPTDSGYRISMTTLDMIGDGGVFTTVDDLLLWDRNFYDNRLGGGESLIRELTAPGRLNDGTVLDYALGLEVGAYRGQPKISHGGAFVGYRAEMVRFPRQHFSVAVLCNRSDANPSRLALEVADVALADELSPPSLPDRKEPAGEPWRPAPADLAEYTGDFWEPTDSTEADIWLESGALLAAQDSEHRYRLTPVTQDVFRMTERPGDVFVYYDRDTVGKVSALRIIVDGSPGGTFRPFERREADAATLTQYAGAFFNSELDVTYTLDMVGNRLMLHVPEQPAVELAPLFGETFVAPDYGAFEFQRAADGAVAGFRLQSGRVRNLVFSRR